MPEPHDPDETVDNSSTPPDSLDAGLAAGFGRPADAPGSVLTQLRTSLGPLRPVLLKEPEGDTALVVKPNSDAMPSKAEAGERYQLSGEIARGGMGAVLRGRDVDLGRDLAVKVLLEKYADNPEVARRFIEEAQIGGQLQHPGVVPVYDIGRFGDRPFFTMKLVKGQTLAHLLAEREDHTEDCPRLLGIALQVAQAMAYAHAKGVIHRDLKPANIMVGAFGEVQVMDWGLAKVLAEGGIADEERASRAHHVPDDVTTIRTARSTGSHGSFGTDTEAGSLLGTPAYMPPEQAVGDIANLDRRADVFGLGAILCEILTGKPPYLGRSNEEVRRKAANGDLADATARLDACGADQELIVLTRKCLAPEAVDRPKDAQQVAEELSTYLNGVQERLQHAERERAVAEAKAIEERRRRKVQLALAASVLALTTLGGLSTTYFLQQRAERARLRTEQAAAVERVVGQAETLLQQAKNQPEDLTRWQVALAAVQQAEATGDEGARSRLHALGIDIQAGLDTAQRDKVLLDRLVDIRSAGVDDPDGSVTDHDYAEALRTAGIDVDNLPPVGAGAKIKARPPSVTLAMAAALDAWAAMRQGRRGNAAGASRLREIAGLADPDPWRVELRATLNQIDSPLRQSTFVALEKKANYDELAPISLLLLGNGLVAAGEHKLAEKVLRKAQQRHPKDVWINYQLGSLLEQFQPHDAIRFYTAARAIRPETSHALAHALERKGDSDEAIGVLQDLNRLRPGNPHNLGCLGRMLKGSGRVQEANEILKAAVVAGRESIRVHPMSAESFCVLGYAQYALDQGDEAIASFKRAIELDPNHAHAYGNLGAILCDFKKDPDGAIIYFRKAIALDPHATNYSNLGNALFDKGQWDEAIAAYKKTIELMPNDARSHLLLGAALMSKGQVDEAIPIYRKGIGLNPNETEGYVYLGRALKAKGQVDEAIASYKKAIELDPKQIRAHYNLGDALSVKGQTEDAIACFKKAVELDPNYAEAYCDLGHALERLGRFAEALAAYRRGHELGSKRPGWTYTSAEWVRQAEKSAALEAKLPALMTGEFQPGDNQQRLELARVCESKRLHHSAAGLYAAAFATDPKLADDLKAGHRYNAACHAALAAAGQCEDATKLDDTQRSRLRKQALDWLRADLALRTQQLESANSADRAEAQQALNHLKEDSDLAGIRDAAALARLPEEEQNAFAQLWADVAALLDHAEEKPK